MGDERLLTTAEVAERLSVSLRRVRQFIEDGRLPSQQFGRDHLIKESDLKLVEGRTPGRPPGKAKQAGNTGKRVTGRANASDGQPARASKQGNKKKGTR